MTSYFEGLCGKIAPGLCRFSMDGRLAIKTSAGYRAYDPDKRTLMNCDHFAFDAGDDFFFVVPTNKVKPGDIILAAGRPKCVLKADGDTITVISYEDATIETMLPERHMFMGNTYLYGKIISMFGNMHKKGSKGMGSLMKYMMFSNMVKQNGKEQNLLPLMMLFGKTDFMDEIDTMLNEDEQEV